MGTAGRLRRKGPAHLPPPARAIAANLTPKNGDRERAQALPPSGAVSLRRRRPAVPVAFRGCRGRAGTVSTSPSISGREALGSSQALQIRRRLGISRLERQHLLEELAGFVLLAGGGQQDGEGAQGGEVVGLDRQGLAEVLLGAGEVAESHLRGPAQVEEVGIAGRGGQRVVGGLEGVLRGLGVGQG